MDSNDNMKINDKMIMGLGKNLQDKVNLNGGIGTNMVAELFNKDGKLIDRREVKNLVTTLGMQMCADQILAAPSVATPGWMEVGTGGSQAAGDTILDAYIAGSRTALDSKTRSGAVVTMVTTFPAETGTGAITEAGVFNVVTENTTQMILYDEFAVVNKGASDSLVITWTLTFA
jgi:hypothetical protein